MSEMDSFGSDLTNALSPFNFAMMLTGLDHRRAGRRPARHHHAERHRAGPAVHLLDGHRAVAAADDLRSTAAASSAGPSPGILFNIPGDPMNVPATWEGYALNKKGHVARALGVAIMGSALGGFLSCLVMTSSPLLSPRSPCPSPRPNTSRSSSWGWSASSSSTPSPSAPR